MTAMSDCRDVFNQSPRLTSSPSARSTLDRHVLSVGAAQRRARAQEVEAEIETACERAAIGPGLHDTPRDTWTKQKWERYVAEAVNQSRTHGAELQALRRDASHLERLAGVV